MTTLDIINGTKKGINVPDANLVPVSSIDDVINLMNLCKKNRAVNDHSSRAHRCTIIILNFLVVALIPTLIQR